MNTIKFLWNRKQYIFSENTQPLLVAEIGVNHNSNVKLAKRLIVAAKLAGADAVKFQTFNTDKIALPTLEKANYISKNIDKLQTAYEMLKSLELSKKDHKEIIKFCTSKKILFFSTPYDFESVDFLESLNVSLYKIASTDLTNIPILKYIANKGKPMIISTGMSTFSEVREAIKACRAQGNNKLVLLQCTANYPTLIENANLRVMDYYRKNLRVLVGYSDQTIGETAGICAVAKGAVYIEKHFTLDKNLPGPDQKMSASPQEFRMYINSLKTAYRTLGNPIKKITSEETDNRVKIQKSIVTIRNLKRGHIISEKDIGIKRPALGLPPKYFYKIIDKKVNKDISANTPIKFTDITGKNL